MSSHETNAHAQRRLHVAWFALSAAGAAGIGLSTAVSAGRSGAVWVRVCALCMLAGFLVVSYLRDASSKGIGRTAPFSEALRDGGASGRGAPFAIAALMFAAAFACCLGADRLCSSLAVDERFVLGIGGLMSCIAAIVFWFKSLERKFALRIEGDSEPRQNEPHDSSGDQDSGSVTAAPAPRLGLQATLCAIVFVAGLGLCGSIRLTPLSHTVTWGLAVGTTCLAVAVACGFALFHVPKAVRQLDDVQGRLVEAMQEKDLYRERTDTIAAEMDNLRERHQDTLEANRKLNDAVSSMRKERLEASPPGSLNAQCAAVIRDYQLTKREGEVLIQLANGRSRKRAAEELLVEASTVSSHVARIYRKLNVHSNQELIDFVRNYR